MVFSTTSFLFVFLPAFLLCYLLLPWRNAVALVFSLLFFAWGEGAYVLLLLATITVNYVAGLGLASARWRKLWLVVGVAVDLLVLGYYKYFGFLVSDVLGLSPPPDSIPHLPIGLSFFIFQSISYLVDVYRGDSPRARSWFDLALYIAMFPQLIAGPIVRYSMVALALRERVVTAHDVFRGGMLFVLGLAYKVLVANNAAEVADAVFEAPIEQVSTLAAWTGTAAYTLQIYFDFAGYSLMAIGIGRVMGFRFPRNFNYPYVSRSITEFWRRWHISLSTWFRDYVYIPLGGNRRGAVRTYVNLFTVFVLCGLWHGAAWTFLAWGLFHGLLLVIERAGFGRLLERSWRPLRHVYVLLLVMISWVLFRSETFTSAWAMLGRMFVPDSTPPDGFWYWVSHENLMWMALGVALSLPLAEHLRATRHPEADEAPDGVSGGEAVMGRLATSCSAVAAFLVLALCAVYVMAGTYNPFIYFRF